jgi:hypothetical protein
MGAISFCKTVEGTNINDVYERLVKDAIRTHGDDSYNGTISTCHLNSRATKSYSNYSIKNEKESMKWIAESENYGEKWEARYVDLGVIGYDVVSIKKKTIKSNAEFKMQYCVYEDTYSSDNKLLAHKDTKKAADDEAIKFALKGKNVIVKKDYIKIKGDNITTKFEVIKKRYKSKPKMQESDTKKIIPIRKFILYGWAAY